VALAVAARGIFLDAPLWARMRRKNRHKSNGCAFSQHRDDPIRLAWRMSAVRGFGVAWLVPGGGEGQP
jgi:hypothetical protein